MKISINYVFFSLIAAFSVFVLGLLLVNDFNPVKTLAFIKNVNQSLNEYGNLPFGVLISLGGAAILGTTALFAAQFVTRKPEILTVFVTLRGSLTPFGEGEYTHELRVRTIREVLVRLGLLPKALRKELVISINRLGRIIIQPPIQECLMPGDRIIIEPKVVR